MKNMYQNWCFSLFNNKIAGINYAHFLIQLAVNVSNIQMWTMSTNSETNDSKCTSQYISEKYWIKTRNKTSIKYT